MQKHVNKKNPKKIKYDYITYEDEIEKKKSLLNKVKKAKNFTDQERNRYQINSVMNIEMWNND